MNKSTGASRIMDAGYPAGMEDEIRRVLDVCADLPNGEDIYSPVFDSPRMFPLQRKRELTQMMQLARSISPKVVMEIGADKSGGLYHWCRSLPTVKEVIACEIRGTPYADSFEDAFPHLQFWWGECSSREPKFVDDVRHWVKDTPIDCLFIDGEKSNFLADFDTYLPMMRKGGLVFLHDVTDWPGPKDAWNTLQTRYRDAFQIHDTSEVQPSLERERLGIPSDSAYESWLRHWKGRSCGVGVIRV